MPLVAASAMPPLAAACGTGADGAYNPVSDSTLAGGTYNFTSVNIPAGVTITVTGSQPLMILCTGNVTINGTLRANGSPGGNGVTYSTFGTGGNGVAGGENGGNGSFSTSAGPLDGVAGAGLGAGGAGKGWSGGGGAGHLLMGGNSGGVGGLGGSAYGNTMLDPIYGGSGGGGGSGGYDCGAGGGGGGGGIIVINACATISIGVGAFIEANGGNGGSDGTGNCGGGGGASGGSIQLTATGITNNGTVQALGGLGGASVVAGSPFYGTGGAGANGRVNLTLSCSALTINPAGPALAAGALGAMYSQFFTQVGGSGSINWSATGALPPGLTLNSVTGELSGIPNTPGTFSFTIKAADTQGCMGTQAYSVTIACPVITLPTSLSNGVQGLAYNQSVVASPAGTYNYAVTTNSLPPGLALNSATGAITGTPTAAGNYSFGITANTGSCSTSRSYNLLITNTCGAITVNPSTLSAGTQGTAYSTSLSATGGVAPYTFNVVSGALPSGLTLDAASGLLSGTPTASGTFVLTIRATGQGGCTGQRTYVLTINCGTVTIDTTLPNGTKGVAYNQTLSASPAGTYTFNVQTGSLPPGYSLSSAGVLSGMSATTGTYTFTIRARTASGCQGTRTYTLNVAP